MRYLPYNGLVPDYVGTKSGKIAVFQFVNFEKDNGTSHFKNGTGIIHHPKRQTLLAYHYTGLFWRLKCGFFVKLCDLASGSGRQLAGTCSVQI